MVGGTTYIYAKCHAGRALHSNLAFEDRSVPEPTLNKDLTEHSTTKPLNPDSFAARNEQRLTTDRHDNTWRRFKNGDISALETIYRGHVQSLVLYGQKICDDEAMVSDCIHDLFLELWKYRASLADMDDPRYYLFRALRNKLLKAVSQRSFVSISELQLASGELPVTSIELDIVVREEAAQSKETLKKLLDKLPRRQQEIISLRYYSNYSYETIAGIMDMNYQSVLNLLQRALKSLRSKYASHRTRP